MEDRPAHTRREPVTGIMVEPLEDYMKREFALIVTLLAMSPAAPAADTSDRTSPLDTNPACMDRTTDASTGNCVVPDEGKPRHAYPPKSSAVTPAPAPAPTPAPAPVSPTLRKSATGK